MSKGAVGYAGNNVISHRPNSNHSNGDGARVTVQASTNPVTTNSAFKLGTSGQTNVSMGQTESARLLASGVQMKRS